MKAFYASVGCIVWADDISYNHSQSKAAYMHSLERERARALAWCICFHNNGTRVVSGGRLGLKWVLWARWYWKRKTQHNTHCEWHFPNKKILKAFIRRSLCFQDMMNREKEDQLPAMQVAFIDSICMPIYEVIIAPINMFHEFSLKVTP